MFLVRGGNMFIKRCSWTNSTVAFQVFTLQLLREVFTDSRQHADWHHDL